MKNSENKKNRIMLKISGEALKWEKEFWINSKSVEELSKRIKNIKKLWIELVIVLGWWNIYRWWNLIKEWVSPADSHNLSMLSTVFNWVVLQNFLNKSWVDSIVLDPNWINFIEQYEKNKAKRFLESWKVVICVGWTGNPYFTTDSWWVLRALELDCNFMIKATKVDWVYDKDPITNYDAILFDEISYNDFISKELKVLDTNSIVLAKENSLKIKVLNFYDETSIVKAIKWEKIWTDIK